ncbi:hypothetical protein [Paenibacillus radicis (ex Xue et al. 2023)]|uniref:Uncharacterized protein n=1 Tax=Paenibacillus radicis (ex Xue et al. 2023) TaxID=2972489 RepID=A0ABT1YCF3_9BACL|nr:hypothetical protein [Paenibacillus radicis (ex Xue et al. 2023)]MCR8630879.1 hypothetical protein [Paenibacillus radicis (ex Xue et al. 2023)]
MEVFVFKTEDLAKKFCESIVQKMSDSFSISKEEAIGRLNKRWINVECITNDDIIFHETDDFWAYDIYYGHNSRWWARKNDDLLMPLPYP